MRKYIKLEFAKKVLGNTIKIMQDGEDLISRKDAIDALARSSVYAWSEEEDQIAHDWALKIISELPEIEALEQEPSEKRGKWLDKNETHQTAICSNCKMVTMQEIWADKLRYYDYCPNCGTRMESDE